MLTDTFYQAVENTADAVIITDRKGKILYVNPAFLKITGYKKEETLGQTPRIIKSGHHRSAFYKKLWKTILSGKSWRTTVINKKKSGELFYTDHTITPVKNQKGKITNFVGIWKDISQQKQLEKQKDEFVDMVGHELKNPITSIKAFLQLLEEKLTHNEGKRSLFLTGRINKQVDKLIDLVGDLLDTTKIKTGQLSFTREVFDLNGLLKETVSDMRISVGDKYHIRLKGKAKIMVIADRFRINQVITNLLTNAVKYSPDNRKIVVELTTDKKNAIISVTDYGIGIPDDKQKNLFQPYYSAHIETKSGQRFASLGLGLFISREIIRQHRGRMWVKSTKNKGSTFYFSLPLFQNPV